MTTLDELLSIVTDPMISADGWGDYYLEVATEIGEQLSQSGELQECLQYLPSLDEEAKVRLVQVITNFPSSGLFAPLLGLLAEANGELAEVLIDGLRTWPLDSEQRQQLLLVAENFRGQSRLLDLVLDNLASTVR